MTCWQLAHPTVEAPGGYMSVVRHRPHVRWAIWLADLVELTLLHPEQRTLAAPRLYSTRLKQPLQMSSDMVAVSVW